MGTCVVDALSAMTANTMSALERALGMLGIPLSENIKYDISLYLRHSKHVNIHFAFIVDMKTGTILCHGNNIYHTNTYPYSIHAEVQTIVKYCRNKRMSGNKKMLLVVRITKKGTLTNSRCCSNCVEFIRGHADHIGIQRVYYSSTNDTLDMLTKKDLTDEDFEYSSGYLSRL